MKICSKCAEVFPDDAGFCPFDGGALAKRTDPWLGKVIASRYRLHKRIGSGGMSVVYLARHVLIERTSAIKILSQRLGTSPAHRERFLREARAVNRINHPNIVEITDVGETDGLAYLVMEYVDGESLLDVIGAHALGWHRAARIAIQIASALARAHQAGVIHRDLKPENVMLLPSFAEDAVKLMDFGIAKLVDLPQITLSEQLFGTPGYIAPEYVAGETIDTRADLYALGVMIYEMVSRRLPFDGKTPTELLLQPLQELPTPLSSRGVSVPHEVEDLVMRLLERDPSKRPHDAFAVHDTLLEALARNPEDGARLSKPPSTPTAPRPSRLLTELPPGAPPREDDESRKTIVTSREELSSPDAIGAPSPSEEDPSARAQRAIDELDRKVDASRRSGSMAFATAGARAKAIGDAARELVPRLERAAARVHEQQPALDRLEAEGRAFRAQLGHAIDELVRDRSRERAHRDAIAVRRQAMLQAPSNQAEDGAWETSMLAEEEARAARTVSDLGFQIDALQRALDAKNAEHDEAIVRAAGELEGSLLATRQLVREISHTVDEAMAIMAAVPNV